MKLLALSTSGAVASAALIENGACTHALAADESRRHAETALPLVEALLRQADTALAEIDCFAVDVGPGSFTGVRIGVSIVNAMAAACGKRVVPVDALRALYQKRGMELPERCCILLDAGNGNGYAVQYLADSEIAPPEAVVCAPYLERLPEETVVVSDLAGEERLIPEAEAVGRAAMKRLDAAVDAAVPLYLRPSQAERMWKLRKEQEAERDGR